MAEIPDVLPGEPVESSWGNSIRDRAVLRYASASDPNLPAVPEPGDIRYLLDVDRLEIFDGSDWVRYVIESDFVPSVLKAHEESGVNFVYVAGGTYNVLSPALTITIPAGWGNSQAVIQGGISGRNETGTGPRLSLRGDINGTLSVAESEVNTKDGVAAYAFAQIGFARDLGPVGPTPVDLTANMRVEVNTGDWRILHYWLQYEITRLD